MKRFNTASTARWAWGTISFFVLFLVTSVPHRVHHLLENLPFPADLSEFQKNADEITPISAIHRHSHPGDHSEHDPLPLHANAPKRDTQHDKSTQTECLIQTVAQNSHLTRVPIVTVTFLGIECAANHQQAFEPSFYFNAAPLSQRAPPQI